MIQDTWMLQRRCKFTCVNVAVVISCLPASSCISATSAIKSQALSVSSVSEGFITRAAWEDMSSWSIKMSLIKLYRYEYRVLNWLPPNFIFRFTNKIFSAFSNYNVINSIRMRYNWNLNLRMILNCWKSQLNKQT